MVKWWSVEVVEWWSVEVVEFIRKAPKTEGWKHSLYTKRKDLTFDELGYA